MYERLTVLGQVGDMIRLLGENRIYMNNKNANSKSMKGPII